MEIVNRNDLKSFITKDGSRIFDIFSPRNSSIKNQSLAEARLSPGQITEEHCHAKSEEIYYILSGIGLMFLGDEHVELNDGDAVIIPPGSKHRIRNVGKGELVFLCSCAPPYSHEDTELVEKKSEKP